MPDKKLTDAEIIKALECCNTEYNNYQCPHCPLLHKGCKRTLIENALDLINRLQAELKNNENIIRLADKTVETANAEIERLKAKCENTQVGYNFLKADFEETEKRNRDLVRAFQSYKAEAYKEFAENAVERVEKAKLKYQRLCKEQGEEMEEHMHIHFNGIIGIINNLLKELVGEDNAK